MTEKATLLFVDDEERILRSLKMLFKAQYNVLTTSDGNEAIEILKSKKVHAIISDQRMPIMPGVEVLRHAKEAAPDTMRLLLTGYSDWAAMVGSVNEGEVFRFINKPWDNEEIKATVDQAVEIAMTTAGMNKEEPKELDTRLGLLVIDDDKETFETIKEIVGDKYAVHWGPALDEAYAVLSEDDNIAVIISEVRIGGEDITAPLKTLKQIYPAILTLVLTSFQDSKTLIDLINQGQIYRFMPKPILKKLVEMSINNAVRQYSYLQKAPQLLKRHTVEKPKGEEVKVSSKIMGYLQKIRKRL